MTKVYMEQAGNHYTVTCKGHATGSPEMCAAISCLVYTLAGWLSNRTALVLEQKLEPGDICLSFVGGQNCEAVFDMVTIGFLQLQQGDPEHIDVDLIWH